MMSGPATLSGSRAAALSPVRRNVAVHRASHQIFIPRAGLLDFFNPAASKSGGAKRGRAQEIVDELLQLSGGTEGGLKVSPSAKEEVEQLVDELEGYCMRSPLRSELIFGGWEVVYASKPQTAGGPFRSPLGRTVFPGQKAKQTISPPNLCVNEVSYKALGFLPGAARQNGEIEPIDERTFQLTFPELDGKAAGGPPRRVIQTLYLDDRVRVAKAIPEDEEADSSFYIFRRVAEAEEEEEEEKEEAPPPQQRSKASAAAFGQLFKWKEGMATQAERSYQNSKAANQPAAQSSRGGGGTEKKRSGTAQLSAQNAAASRAAAKAAVEDQRRLARQQAAAAKASAEQERQRAKEQASAAKAAAEEERRKAQAKAEADRAAVAQRKQAAREQYEDLAALAAEADKDAREAVAAVRPVERESAVQGQQAGQVRNFVDKAVATAEAATARFVAAQGEEVAVEKEVLTAQRAVNELEKQLRRQAALVAPHSK